MSGRRDREKFMDRTMAHKYNMVHHVQRLGEPQLSGLYLKNFYNTAKRYRLPLPESIRADNVKFCGNCGCVRIAGYNLTMNLLRETDENGVVTRNLRYQCGHCQSEYNFEVDKTEPKKDPSSKEASPKVDIQWPRQSSPEVNDDKIKKNTTAKERAKKRKQSTLSNLLASKKEKEESKKKNVSLSLMDFMK
ncbi:Snm1 [Kluyveromyces lactis]|nr:Snm1 [Kluyveromyces lactis]